MKPSHVITMLSKWCQAAGVQWVMGGHNLRYVMWQGLQESKPSEQLFDRELKSRVWQPIWQVRLRKQHVSGRWRLSPEEPSCVSSTVQFALCEFYGNHLCDSFPLPPLRTQCGGWFEMCSDKWLVLLIKCLIHPQCSSVAEERTKSCHHKKLAGKLIAGKKERKGQAETEKKGTLTDK